MPTPNTDSCDRKVNSGIQMYRFQHHLNLNHIESYMHKSFVMIKSE